MKKELRDLVKRIEAAGGSVERSGSGHWKVRYQGRMVCVLPATASDHRSIKNAISQMRRNGLELDK